MALRKKKVGLPGGLLTMMVRASHVVAEQLMEHNVFLEQYSVTELPNDGAPMFYYSMMRDATKKQRNVLIDEHGDPKSEFMLPDKFSALMWKMLTNGLKKTEDLIEWNGDGEWGVRNYAKVLRERPLVPLSYARRHGHFLTESYNEHQAVAIVLSFLRYYNKAEEAISLLTEKHYDALNTPEYERFRVSPDSCIGRDISMLVKKYLLLSIALTQEEMPFNPNVPLEWQTETQITTIIAKLNNVDQFEHLRKMLMHAHVEREEEMGVQDFRKSLNLKKDVQRQAKQDAKDQRKARRKA